METPALSLSTTLVESSFRGLLRMSHLSFSFINTIIMTNSYAKLTPSLFSEAGRDGTKTALLQRCVPLVRNSASPPAASPFELEVNRYFLLRFSGED